MNHNEIDDTPAGPMLDALVAEHVMGWEWRNLEPDLRVLIAPGAAHLLMAGVVIEKGKPPYLNDNLPNFSTHWSAAGRVIDYLMLDGWRFECGIEDEPFYAFFTKGQRQWFGFAHRGIPGEPVCAAICRAAVKTVTR